MKALVLKDYRKFSFEEVPMPEYGDDDVLIRVMACAICGSDVHGMDGSSGRRIPPIIMGHEASGVIEKAGANVKGYQAGDRVTFDSTEYCGVCERCARGEINLCESRRVLGVSCVDYRRHGAMAEYVAVPARILYRIPEAVRFEQAAMIEPLAIAQHAVTRFPAPVGGTAVVVGTGTIGLLVVQVLKTFGVKTVIAVDLLEEKLAIAKANGADMAFNPVKPGIVDEILARFPGGVDAAYDATGIGATVDFCLRVTRTGGKIGLIGNIAQKIEFPLQWVVTRQISLFGSCNCAGEYPQCIDLIASKKVNVDVMMSKIAPLCEGAEWFERLYNKEKGLFKVVLKP